MDQGELVKLAEDSAEEGSDDKVNSCKGGRKHKVAAVETDGLSCTCKKCGAAWAALSEASALASPRELTLHILTFLSNSDVLRCDVVCKALKDARSSLSARVLLSSIDSTTWLSKNYDRITELEASIADYACQLQKSRQDALRELSAGFVSLQQVKVLSISGGDGRCSQKLTLPESVWRIRTLQQLHVSGVKLMPPGTVGAARSYRYTAPNLEQLSIRDSEQETLDFIVFLAPNLTRMTVTCCPRLKSLGADFSSMTTLLHLAVQFCDALHSLPAGLQHLPHLTALIVSGQQDSPDKSIPNLSKFPALQQLTYTSSRATYPPDDIFALESLQKMNLSCSSALKLCGPGVHIYKLRNLQTLSLHGDSILQLPDSFCMLGKLQTLTLRQASLLQLPANFGHLSSIQQLTLTDCEALRRLPASFAALTALTNLDLCCCMQLHGGLDIRAMQRLVKLQIMFCGKMKPLHAASFQQLTALQSVNISWCGEALMGLGSKSFNSNLQGLTQLEFTGDTSTAAVLSGIGSLPALQKAIFRDNKALTSIPINFMQNSTLRSLHLGSCRALKVLPESIEGLQSLTLLVLQGCPALQELPANIGCLRNLQQLQVDGCTALTALPAGLGRATALKGLNICGASSLAALPDSIGKLTRLQSLCISSCCKLTAIPDTLHKLQHLERFIICGCARLATLPSSLGRACALEYIAIRSCPALKCIPSSWKALLCRSLAGLQIKYCPKLQYIPRDLQKLSGVEVEEH